MNLAVMYHYVKEPAEWTGSVPVSPKEFENQIDRLAKKFEFVAPDELMKKTLKPKCVLTFDDATKDQYENAFAIMKKKGVPGYFTVMSGPLVEKKVPIFHLVHTALSLFNDSELWEKLNDRFDRSKFENLIGAHQIYGYEKSELRRYIKYLLNFTLTPQESRKFLEDIIAAEFGSSDKFIEQMYININEFEIMRKAGMTLGVHCVSHKPFSHDAMNYYKNEIEPCAQFLADRLQIKAEWYTPPFGGGVEAQRMKKDLKSILINEGYKGAFVTTEGFISEKQDFWLKRVDCNKLYSISL
ncbi:polysaccharide deacetylase [Saccharibacillus sp. O23]|nr:polysaccharide deacetylase [Saccharibacillus sp. O23]